MIAFANIITQKLRSFIYPVQYRDDIDTKMIELRSAFDIHDIHFLMSNIYFNLMFQVLMVLDLCYHAKLECIDYF